MDQLKQSLGAAKLEFDKHLGELKAKSTAAAKHSAQKIARLEKEIQVYKEKLTHLRNMGAAAASSTTAGAAATSIANSHQYSIHENGESLATASVVSNSAKSVVAGAGGFYLKSNEIAAATARYDEDERQERNGSINGSLVQQSNHNEASVGGAGASHRITTKFVKVSRKDLRLLSQDELIKRSSTTRKDSFNATLTSQDQP